MFKRRLINPGFLIILLLVPFFMYGQYTVTGGEKSPLLAIQNIIMILTCTLCTARMRRDYYTSSRLLMQWYRYRQKHWKLNYCCSTDGVCLCCETWKMDTWYFVKESTAYKICVDY
jgi:hypothetical protein